MPTTFARKSADPKSFNHAGVVAVSGDMKTEPTEMDLITYSDITLF
jgi:hypothetical protein